MDNSWNGGSLGKNKGKANYIKKFSNGDQLYQIDIEITVKNHLFA